MNEISIFFSVFKAFQRSLNQASDKRVQCSVFVSQLLFGATHSRWPSFETAMHQTYNNDFIPIITACSDVVHATVSPLEIRPLLAFHKPAF